MTDRAHWHISLHNPRLIIALCAIISLVPLMSPAFPPLVDVPGHMGRFAVQIGIADDPFLQRWFSFSWALIGNLGVDLLVQMLGPWLGIELAVKLIVMAIVALTIIGLLRVARVATGRIGPAAFFALPLAYSFPFHFGFVNYCLSMALALNAFAWWMQLGQQGRLRTRALLSIPISFFIWLTHIGGWGALGIFAFASESVRLRSGGASLMRSVLEGGRNCLTLALPLLITLFVRAQNSAGSTGDWFNWPSKYFWFSTALSDRWQLFDFFSAMLLMIIIISARILSSLRFNPVLGLAALLLFAAVILTPRILIGSAYADMRLAPFVLALALLAIETKPGLGAILSRVLMALGLTFFLVRTAATTESFRRYDVDMRQELIALDHVPRHARIVALVGRKCYAEWQLERRTHLPSLAIVRRHAFTNDQFVMPGAQLLGVAYKAGEPFLIDPSQMVTDDSCVRPDWLTYTKSVALIPRGAFDYLWVIGAPPESKADLRGFEPVWQRGRSALYRIRPAAPPPMKSQMAEVSAQ
jgi:hypothetical protein